MSKVDGEGTLRDIATAALPDWARHRQRK